MFSADGRAWRTFILSALLVVNLLLMGSPAGYAAEGHSLVELAENYVVEKDYPTSERPESMVDRDLHVSKYQAEFHRPRTDTEVFGFTSHDPMVVTENGITYLIVATTVHDVLRLGFGGAHFGVDRNLIVGTQGSHSLYRAPSLSTDPSEWVLVNPHYLSNNYEYDSVINVEGRYVLYGNGNIYTAPSVTTNNWTLRTENTGFRDLGAYYDDETGMVHIYYERGSAAGYSGKQIGHAVSPNGVSNWTIYPPVWTAPEGFGVGDFDIVKHKDRIFIFGDYDPSHPKYTVSVWVNTNLYTRFSRLKAPAIEPRRRHTAYGDDLGIGDPTVIRTGEGQYVLLANGYSTETAPPTIHYYVGTIRSPNSTRTDSDS